MAFFTRQIQKFEGSRCQHKDDESKLIPLLWAMLG